MPDDIASHGLAFGQVAEHYDKGRPSYPEALIDDVVRLCGPESRVLDVGAGTGIATVLLAGRGLRVTAIEPFEEMAEAARHRCASYQGVSVVTSTFEAWTGEPDAFDLVVSAQAWHWLKPGRYDKARHVLRPGGGLAVFWSQPLWEEFLLGAALERVYWVHAPQLVAFAPWFPGFRGVATSDQIDADEAAGAFGPFLERSHRWSQSYSADEYDSLVQSLPEHLALSDDDRRRLLTHLAEVVNDAGGVLDLAFVTRLYTATRLDEATAGRVRRTLIAGLASSA